MRGPTTSKAAILAADFSLVPVGGCSAPGCSIVGCPAVGSGSNLPVGNATGALEDAPLVVSRLGPYGPGWWGGDRSGGQGLGVDRGRASG
jgi:hypothetical protein